MMPRDAPFTRAEYRCAPPRLRARFSLFCAPLFDMPRHGDIY